MSLNPETAPEPTARERTWLRDAAEVLVIAVVLYLVIWTCIQTVKVDGVSMVNTLQNGDLLIASKISYRFGTPERGDIVILIPPCDPTLPAQECSQDKDYIKRVIGLPGDRIEIDGTQHPTALLIEPGGTGPWTRVAEPYLPDDWVNNNNCCESDGQIARTTNQRPAVFQVPAGYYWVMGDNRNASNDSRYFGFVARDKIQAKAILRIWPLDRFGSLGPQMTLVTVPLTPAFALLWLRLSGRRFRRELRAALESRAP